MNQRNAERLASLVIDEWPLPRFVRLWIESHPDVAKELASMRNLEAELRGESRSTHEPLECITPTRPASQIDRRLLGSLLVATAAVFLILLGAWHWQQSQIADTETTEKQLPNLKPVIASVTAGQTVARGVSTGAQKLLLRFTHAAHQFAGASSEPGGSAPGTETDANDNADQAG